MMKSVWQRHRYKLLPAGLVFLALILAVIFHRPLIAWFSGEPLAGDGGPATTEVIGNLSLSLRFEPDPPRQSDNTLLIQIEDAKGEPVEHADVAVRYSMPAMGAMPEMRGEAKVEHDENGLYRAEFDLAMGGTWTLDLEIKTEKQGSASARYTFTVGSKGLTKVGGAGSAPKPERAQIEPLPPQEFPENVLVTLQTAYEAYEEIRARLASDSLNGVAPRAHRIAEALKAAAATQAEAPPVQKELEVGAQAAHKLAEAKDLETARLSFADLSRTLILLAACDERLAKGRHVFECPMVKGYDRWLQTSEQLMNPYMGPKMLQCGSEADFPTAHADPHAGHAAPGSEEIAYYTCPMHPSVKQKDPGTCPICAMDLTPVTKGEVETGVIFVDAAKRQLIGVKTAKVERRQVQKSVRTIGKITYDETRLVDVTLKFQGWIGQLKADATGQRVKRGQTLFTVYSPEVYAAQQDLLIASRSASAVSGLAAERNGSLVQAARRRLKLWDISSWVADQVIKKGEPVQYVPVASPASGFIVEKNVVAGSTVEPGARLYRIADLNKVWIEAEIYEAELPLVKVGQNAKVTLSYQPDKQFDGKITFVFPYLSGATRTGQVRIELENPEVELKPDMYANVEFQLDRGERLVVPESAVIYAGPRRIVFLDLGEGKLRPQQVVVGLKVGDYYEVTSGLREGQKIVTSGNFLIAAESRLKSATGQW